jgi:hypothetical protein
MVELRPIDALKAEIGDDGPVSGPLAHLEESHDSREFVAGDLLVAHFHFATGGRLMRIASMLPPVLSPNSVPRS